MEEEVDCKNGRESRWSKEDIGELERKGGRKCRGRDG